MEVALAVGTNGESLCGGRRNRKFAPEQLDHRSIYICKRISLVEKTADWTNQKRSKILKRIWQVLFGFI